MIFCFDVLCCFGVLYCYLEVGISVGEIHKSPRGLRKPRKSPIRPSDDPHGVPEVPRREVATDDGIGTGYGLFGRDDLTSFDHVVHLRSGKMRSYDTTSQGRLG